MNRKQSANAVGRYLFFVLIVLVGGGIVVYVNRTSREATPSQESLGILAPRDTPTAANTEALPTADSVGKQPAVPATLTPLQERGIQEVVALADGFGFSKEVCHQAWNDIHSGIVNVPGASRNTAEVLGLFVAGQWDTALRMAEERLARNPRDLAGLLIKNEYGRCTGVADMYLDTAKAILDVLPHLETTAVQLAMPALVHDLKSNAQSLRHNVRGTPDKPNRFVTCVNAEYLMACESDGLFSSASADSQSTKTSAISQFSEAELQKLTEVIQLAQKVSAQHPFAGSDEQPLLQKAIGRSGANDVDTPYSGPMFDHNNPYAYCQRIRHMWYDYKWDDVLKIAEERLATNPRDLPGLLLKNGYAERTGAFDEFLDTTKAILDAVPEVKTPALSALLPLLVNDMRREMERLRRTNPAVLAAMRKSKVGRTGDTSGRRGAYQPRALYIQACESDGLL